jgi:ABC-2 type transport system permease protein
MNTVTAQAGSATAAAGRTTAAGRLRALGRAEATLLLRSRTTLFAALLVPVAMMVGLKVSLDQEDVTKAGMSVGAIAVIGGIGTVLMTAAYTTLTSVYTARRESLVLKRLRTGETSDREILSGSALPPVALALAQCVVLVVVGTVLLGLQAPRHPVLLIAGVSAGLVLMSLLAAATSAVTRTVEGAQITTLPLFLVSLAGSGIFLPLTLLPDALADVCRLLPVTGVMTLIRAGWLGGVSGGGLAGAGAASLVWIGAGVFAVQRWFKWEPRR